MLNPDRKHDCGQHQCGRESPAKTVDKRIKRLSFFPLQAVKFAAMKQARGWEEQVPQTHGGPRLEEERRQPGGAVRHSAWEATMTALWP